jgi:nitrogen-specific signal transduction histidine kinase/FixJ family two-component response regulator
MSTPELAPAPLKVLLVEDNAEDAFLLERHLRRSGFLPDLTRVETESEMLAALDGAELPSIVLADYNLPSFSGPAALHLIKARNLDIPFIMLSGAVSEETAVSSMRAGAQDYVSKQNLARLVPAIRRELAEAAQRREHLAAERALRDSELRFQSLIAAMPLGLLISDANGRVTYANSAAQRLLRYTERDILSGAVTLGSICPKLSTTITALAQGNASIEPTEATCFTGDASSIEALVAVTSLVPHASWEQRQLAAFIADLSLQKRSEETLRRTEKLAVTGRLAAAIAHEINNPLEAVMNCLYLLEQSDLPDEARRYLTLAQKELDRVTQITIQTLRFFRSSTRPAATDVHEVIDNVLSLLESRVRQSEIEVVRQFRADTLICAHQGELRQVFANLIGNAIDAVPPHGPHRGAHVYGTRLEDGPPGLDHHRRR